MLDLSLAAAIEVLDAAIGGEAGRIPEANWCLHTKLALEGPQGGSGVEAPVTPGGASEAILQCSIQLMKHASTVS